MWPYFIHKLVRWKQFTNLINQELELDYCSSTVMLAITFYSWTTKAVINFIKEFMVCVSFFIAIDKLYNRLKYFNDLIQAIY